MTHSSRFDYLSAGHRQVGIGSGRLRDRMGLELARNCDMIGAGRRARWTVGRSNSIGDRCQGDWMFRNHMVLPDIGPFAEQRSATRGCATRIVALRWGGESLSRLDARTLHDRLSRIPQNSVVVSDRMEPGTQSMRRTRYSGSSSPVAAGRIRTNVERKVGAMGNQSMNVDEAQLMSAKQDVEVAVDNIKTLINAARGDAENMRAGWQGDAAKMFSQVADDWSVESDKVNRMLDEIKLAMGDTHTKTTQAEQDNTHQLKL